MDAEIHKGKLNLFKSNPICDRTLPPFITMRSRKLTRSQQKLRELATEDMFRSLMNYFNGHVKTK